MALPKHDNIDIEERTARLYGIEGSAVHLHQRCVTVIGTKAGEVLVSEAGRSQGTIRGDKAAQ